MRLNCSEPTDGQGGNEELFDLWFPLLAPKILALKIENCALRLMKSNLQENLGRIL
jgi:hypothetical protein